MKKIDVVRRKADRNKTEKKRLESGFLKVNVLRGRSWSYSSEPASNDDGR
jgi:hypothetical protein